MLLAEDADAHGRVERGVPSGDHRLVADQLPVPGDETRVQDQVAAHNRFLGTNLIPRSVIYIGCVCAIVDQSNTCIKLTIDQQSLFFFPLCTKMRPAM